MTQATVRFAERDYPVVPEEELTFGRAPDCTICLDAEDVSISRLAGSLGYEHGTWWLTNRSAARPLSVLDDLGFRSVLPPGRRTAVEAPTRIVVDGTNGSHALLVTVDGAGTDRLDTPPPGEQTAVGAEVLISSADRLALIALFAGYLEEPPKHDPYPKSYAAAAARLGWPRTTLVKRIEYLRTRLTNAGVPNLMGWNALANLAEYAISRGLITKEDLAQLKR